MFSFVNIHLSLFSHLLYHFCKFQLPADIKLIFFFSFFNIVSFIVFQSVSNNSRT